MPALPNVPNVIRSRIKWTVDGDPMAQSVNYWRFSGSAASITDMENFAAALVSSGDSAFGPACHTTIGMDNAEVTDLTSGSSVQATSGTPWLGTASGAMLAPGTAALVNHTIARRYRGGKPRTYLPVGVATDLASNGLWSGSFVTIINTAFAGWVAAVSTTYGALTITAIVNVSFYSGFTSVQNPVTLRWKNLAKPRATALVDTITGSGTSLTVGSQRRRNKDA